MICFYHKSDFDGIASAALVKLRFPDAVLIGVDYRNKVAEFQDLIDQEERREIVIVDFCFSYDEMETLAKWGDVTWVDHHKTSIEMMEPIATYFPGYRMVGKAACELVWEFFFKTELPPAIFLLGRYDVWDHEHKDVLPFQYGMRMTTWERHRPDNVDFWALLVYDLAFYNEIFKTGHIVFDYQMAQNEKIAKGMFFEKYFFEYRAIIINQPYSNSLLFKSVYDPDKHDIMIIIGIKGDEFKYTLFSDKPDVDVSVIAKKFGGGGHRGAAGFYSNKYLFYSNEECSND